MSTAAKQIERPAPQTDEWMSLPQAGAVLGVTRPTVLVWALKGMLVSMQIAGRTVVSRASVEQLAREREAAR